MQNSVIHIEIEFQKLLYKVKLHLSVACIVPHGQHVMRSVVGTSCQLTIQANKPHAIPPRSTPLHFESWDVYGSTSTEEPLAAIQTVRYPSLHDPLSCKRPYFCLRALNSISIICSWSRLRVFNPLPKSYYSKVETTEVRAHCDCTPPNSGTILYLQNNWLQN